MADGLTVADGVGCCDTRVGVREGLVVRVSVLLAADVTVADGVLFGDDEGIADGVLFDDDEGVADGVLFDDDGDVADGDIRLSTIGVSVAVRPVDTVGLPTNVGVRKGEGVANNRVGVATDEGKDGVEPALRIGDGVLRVGAGKLVPNGTSPVDLASG